MIMNLSTLISSCCFVNEEINLQKKLIEYPLQFMGIEVWLIHWL